MANTMMNYPYTPQESSSWFQQQHQHQVVQQQAAHHHHQQATMMTTTMPSVATNSTPSSVPAFTAGNRTSMTHPHAMSHHLNHSAFTSMYGGWY
jgi:hypothetical protein